MKQVLDIAVSLIQATGAVVMSPDFQPWMGVLMNVIVAAFIYGGLYTRVKDHNDDIKAIKENDRRQWDRIDHHGERLTRVETKIGLDGKARGANGSGWNN